MDVTGEAGQSAAATQPSARRPTDLTTTTPVIHRVLRRRWVRAAVALALAAALAWSGRYRVLAAAGRLLVAEDALANVDAIVVSMAGGLDASMEARGLFQDRVAPLILLPVWQEDPVEDELRKLGLTRLRPPGLMAYVLELSGIPAGAVQNLPGIVDGTDTEVAAIAAFARQHQLASVLYLTPRAHTARARWLLNRQLPPGTRLYVRSPRTDTFSPSTWWQSRDESREVVIEYLRWLNTMVLGDLWAR